MTTNNKKYYTNIILVILILLVLSAYFILEPTRRGGRHWTNPMVSLDVSKAIWDNDKKAWRIDKFIPPPKTSVAWLTISEEVLGLIDKRVIVYENGQRLDRGILEKNLTEKNTRGRYALYLPLISNSNVPENLKDVTSSTLYITPSDGLDLTISKNKYTTASPWIIKARWLVALLGASLILIFAALVINYKHILCSKAGQLVKQKSHLFFARLSVSSKLIINFIVNRNKKISLSFLNDAVVIEKTNADVLVELIIDIFILVSATFTLSYYVVLFSQLSAWVWYPLSVAFLLLGFYIFYRNGKLSLKKINIDSIVVVLFFTCLLALCINLFTVRPDADDVNFFHRGIYAAENLLQPFSIYQTAYYVYDFPALSPVHLLTSVETSAALIARALHIPYMPFVHQGIGGIVLFLVPIVYFCLFRVLGMNPIQSVTGVFGVLFFLAITGDSHRALGNFTIVRAWQGKCILVLLILPLIWATSLRYMLDNHRGDLWRVHTIMLIGIGLTSSAFFLLPYSAGLLCLAIYAMKYFDRVVLFRLLKISSSLLVPVALALLSFSPLFVQLTDTTVWEDSSYEWSTWQLFNLVVPNTYYIVAYIAAICLVAWYGALRQRWMLFLVYALIAVTIPLLPIASDILLKLTKPGAYWRLFYAFPITVLFGLLTCISIGMVEQKRLIFCVWFVGLVMFMLVTHTYTLNKEVSSGFHASKFDQKSLNVIGPIIHNMKEGVTVLTVEEIAYPLALIRPDLKFVSVRPTEISHIVKNYQNEKSKEIEGLILVSDFLSSPCSEYKSVDFLRPYVSRADIVILPNCMDDKIHSIFLDKSDMWMVSKLTNFKIWKRIYDHK